MTDTSCSDSDVSKNGKDGLAAGSRAFLNNSPSEAVENFKAILEKTSCKSNQKIPVSQLVLRYALCLALIKCNDYNHIAEAVTILLELIDSGYANKLPSLYLALGKAYFALNRFKSALDFIDKGLKAIQTTSKIKQHMWPGLQQTIDDTIKENLHKELIKLQKGCKQSHIPTALCHFEKCIENSAHLIPSQEIYLTDPDFKPFLYIQCNSNCKYAYHDSCWKHLTRIDLNLDDPKDLLGTSCSACSSKIKNDSVIVEVNLIGSEFGFDKPLSTWLLDEDKCPNMKSRNQVKSNTSSPFKGNSKPVSSNGSLTKSCVRNTGLRTPEAHNISMPRTNPAQPVYVYQPLPQPMIRPFPCPIYQPGYNYVQGVGIVGPRPVYYIPPPPAQWSQWPRAEAPYLTVNNNSYQQPSLQQRPPTCVEVTVSDTQVLSSGTTLIVPVTPSGGPCKIVRPPMVGSQIQTPHPKCFSNQCKKTPPKSVTSEFKRDVCQKAEEEVACCSDGSVKSKGELPKESPIAAIGSVVDEFKSVVWKLAGKSPSTHDTSLNSDESSNANIKSVVEEFKKLVLSLSGEDSRNDMKKEMSNFVTNSPQSQDTHPTSQASMSEQLLISEASTLQAKVSPTEDENSSEHSSIHSSQDDVRSELQDSTKLAHLLDILHQCRKLDFGYLPSENMNPELQCFGHPYVDSSNFVEPNEIDESDKDQADFVFSYYYSVFERNGLHRLEDIQEKWRTTITEDIGLPEKFTNKYSSVSEFLLKSEKFAAIDEFIGTSDLLPDMFSKAQVEIAESVSFLLFSQDSNTNNIDELNSADTFNDAWKIKMNNNNNAHTHHNLQSSASADDSGSDHSDDCERSDHVALSNDTNDNPICTSSATFNSNKSIVAPEVNGMPTSISGCNASSMADVYMSDEDEEIDSSLVIDGVVKDVPPEWSGAQSKPDVLDKQSQTDHIVDVEKENLAKSKDSLLKEVSELRYEKGELHQRIESLQFQMETNRATMESLYESTLKQTQEKHDEKLLEKSLELKEIRDKHCALEQTIVELERKNEAKENEVAKLTLSLQKIQRNHAKEMNNFEQRLQEGMKHKLAESIKQSKHYIQLWKDFCDFKINKYNQTCNDRINVLSQLRDMVSDSVHPTKSDLSTMIEKYEDSMIAVTQKNAEVNDIFNKQMDRMKSGLEVQLPAVVDVPDLMNMPYPPEGVFDQLRTVIKPKQEDFSVPQNHFLGGSRFFPPRTFNGLQSRENEGFGSGSSSSLFGQGHNETHHLWNTPSISFDVNNTGNSQYHQGFGSSNPIMQQPSLNLMPNLMYQSSTQNPMLAQRTTPSPSLSLSSVNGSAFTSNASTPGLSTPLGSLAAPGSKIPPLGPPSQKHLGNPTPVISQPVKTTASPVPSSAPAPVSPPQGAIPKPRVQTATASMTPIVPSKPKPVLKGVRGHESNYEKLMRNLQKMFPTRTDMELTQALKLARERNNNSLSSLSHSEIVSRVEEILNTFRKQTSMSWEKFGQAAWGTAKTPVIEWEGQEQDECCICMAPMQAREVYTLECKHAFHKDCIKKWLEQESVCPNCRTHSTMVDEFPPLG